MNAANGIILSLKINVLNAKWKRKNETMYKSTITFPPVDEWSAALQQWVKYEMELTKRDHRKQLITMTNNWVKKIFLTKKQT